MITITHLDSLRFVQVTFTLNGISTYLIHRVELSYEDIKKYNSILVSNYLERLNDKERQKLKISVLINLVETYMMLNYDNERITNVYNRSK